MAVEPWTDLEVPAGPKAPAQARMWLEPVRPLMDSHRMDDLRFVVSELVVNCLQHADLDPGDPIALAGEVNDGSVSVTVADGGPGFEFTPRPMPPVDDGSGHGLLVIAAMSLALVVGEGWVTVEVARR